MTENQKKWNHEGLICDYCSANQFPVEQCNHVRGGKTKWEHRKKGYTSADVPEVQNK